MSAPSIKKNYFFNLVSQLLAIVLPIVTTPYVTRVLGNENLGIFNYAQSIINYFIMFGCVGMYAYGQREIAACKDDPQKRSIVFYEIQATKAVTISLSALIYWLFIVRTADQPLYYCIFALELFAAFMDVSWFLQGSEVFGPQALRAIVTRLLGLACIFLFVKKQSDLHIYIWCCSGALLAGNISVWFFIKKQLQPVRLKQLRPLRHLGPAFMLFLPQIAASIYTQLDKTMTGIFTNYDYNQVGYYSQAEKIVRLSTTVVTSIGAVMMSRVTVALSQQNLAAAKEYITKSFRFVFLLAWPISIGLATIAPDMVPWFFGDGFEPVALCMAALSPLTLLLSIGNVLGSQYMIPAKKTVPYTVSIFCGLAVNLGMNALLIPRFGAMGAIMASLLAEVVVDTRHFFALRKEIAPTILLKGTKNILAAAVMGVGIYLLSLWLPSVIWATALEIAVGCVVYFGMLLVLKDDFFIKNLTFLLKK